MTKATWLWLALLVVCTGPWGLATILALWIWSELR